MAAADARPVEVVQRQLEAYNAHDLAAFMATYSESIRLYRLPNAAAAFESKAAMAEFYGQHRFTIPDLRAEILNRMVLGNKVVDHERVHGLPEGVIEAVAVYEVTDGLIESVWFVYPQ